MDLLQKGADIFGLSNIKKILSFEHSKTTCDENLERHGLDPWVQWVSVHTGTRMDNHRVVSMEMSQNLFTHKFGKSLGTKE